MYDVMKESVSWYDIMKLLVICCLFQVVKQRLRHFLLD